MFDIKGKVALITGSTRGIGKAIAISMANLGARVVISSRKAEACDAVVKEITDQGGEAMAIPCNVRKRDDLDALVAGVNKAWGGVDILVCNAAINPHFGPLSEIDPDTFDAIMTANAGNTLYLCNQVIPNIATRGGGSVIVISSVAAFKGTRNIGAYGISKAADVQIVRNLAIEWASKNVQVNGIAPGIIKTDFARALWEDPATYENAVKDYPIGRLGDTDDIAGVAVFLASPAAKFMAGQTLVIDGGAMAAGGQYS